MLIGSILKEGTEAKKHSLLQGITLPKSLLTSLLLTAVQTLSYNVNNKAVARIALSFTEVSGGRGFSHWSCTYRTYRQT